MFKKSTEIIQINVLLVDDKKENLFSLEKLLEEEDGGINFIQSTSGHEALRIALNNEIALILLDVQMPEIDGYEVANLLKENSKTKNIPIILVTALTQEPSYILQGYAMGAVDYLFKPLNPELTRAKVKAFIRIYTQQKELEQKNILLENLGLLVNNSVDIMCILEGAGLNIITANPAWEHTLGYSAEEITGTSFLKYVARPDDLEKHLTKSLHTDDKLFNYENQLIAKNGTAKWFLWGFVSKNGKLYASARDINQRKSAEEALNTAYNEMELRVKERTFDLQKSNGALREEIEKRSKVEENLRFINEKLIRTNEDLDSFVYTASHDLKLPIANIEGLIQTLGNEIKPLTVSTENIIDMLRHSVAQLRETIQDLLKIIKVQKENSVEIEEINCEELLDEIKLSIKDLIETAHAKIQVDFDRCDKVKLSRACLKSILYNLLTNALKYKSPERDSVIEIKIHPEAEYSVLSIKDNGLGIKKENLHKLFTMFKRLHDHVEGSGIGLYIVKNTVEKYGGRIEVESEEGVGTEFKIYFKN